jgi:hypothetical protein
MLRGLTLITAAIVCGCGRQALTPEEAAAKIRAIPQFQQMRTVTVTLTTPFTEPVTILNRLGYISSRVTAAGDTFFLSARGKEAARDWTVRQDLQHPARESYTVPLASRELVAVGRIRSDPAVARADILWRYKPNEIGRAMGLDEEVRPATVYFRLLENTWFVDETNLPIL